MCLSCHDVHGSNNGGMLVNKQGAVCSSFHGDFDKAFSQGASKHSPVAAGECTKCHNPHKSAITKLLLAKGIDLCLTCHKELKERMGQMRTHAPAGRDCLRCHKPHVSAEQSLLFQPVGKVCSECHDVKGKQFGKSHLDIDAETIDCNSCHDPHASKDPKFFKKNMHAPFAGRSCDNCHIVEKK